MQQSRPYRSGRIGVAIPADSQTRRDLRRRTVSYRLVCGIAYDADAHRSRHSNQPDSVHSVARELATHHDHIHHHGDRSLSPVLTAGRSFRFCSTAAVLLAAAADDARLLPGAHATCESLAPEKILDLIAGDKPLRSLDQRSHVSVMRSVCALPRASGSVFHRVDPCAGAATIRKGRFPWDATWPPSRR
jgi:hypothetical protein